MRIIAGLHKGKRLTAPKTLPVRPTTDFAKEALFTILNHRIDFDQISVLDLFAGTGNISYEFASRGTSMITSIDSHFGCVKYIQKISEELSLNIKTIKSDVFKYVNTGITSYDLIFADPPYDFTIDRLELLIGTLFKKNMVNEEGIIIIEHTKHSDLSSISNFREARRYGGSVFSFFGSLIK